MLTPNAVITLENRGLQSETLVRFGIDSIDRADGNEWISIPYFVGNEIINRKYRTIGGPKKFYQEGGARKALWNVNALLDATLADEPVIICEGELDALSCIEADFARVVSVPDGAPAQEIGDKPSDKYSYLDDVKPNLREAKEIILATDNDGPGINLLNDLALRIGKAKCKWVQYPLKRGSQERCKDMNEVLCLYGPDGVRKTIAKARYIVVDGVYAMDELPPIVESPVYDIGILGLSDHWKMRKGDFVVVTGIPSHGKSSFLNDVACRMALNHGWRTAFGSFEQTPQTDHRRNLTAWHSGIRNPTLRVGEWINHHFRFIVPKEDEVRDIDWLKERMQIAAIQHQCDMIVIDPWNELEHGGRWEGETTTDYIGRALSEIKSLARSLNVALIIAAHPKKIYKDKDGKTPAPTMYDISDSSHWSNRADVGITVYRPDLKINETIIGIVKVRYQHIVGKPGAIKTHYLFDSRRYEVTE